MVENILDSMAIQRELALVKIRVTGDFCLPDKLIQQYQLLVVDRGLESLVLEATGIPTRHRQADQVAGSLGVMETVQTGKVAMARGPTSTSYLTAFGDRSGTRTWFLGESRISQLNCRVTRLSPSPYTHRPQLVLVTVPPID
jgi:hypothetical protein